MMMTLSLMCADLPGSLTMSSFVNPVAIAASSFWMGKIISLDELYVVIIGKTKLDICVQTEQLNCLASLKKKQKKNLESCREINRDKISHLKNV